MSRSVARRHHAIDPPQVFHWLVRSVILIYLASYAVECIAWRSSPGAGSTPPFETVVMFRSVRSFHQLFLSTPHSGLRCRISIILRRQHRSALSNSTTLFCDNCMKRNEGRPRRPDACLNDYELSRAYQIVMQLRAMSPTFTDDLILNSTLIHHIMSIPRVSSRARKSRADSFRLHTTLDEYSDFRYPTSKLDPRLEQ